jgi:hypothetical protein
MIIIKESSAFYQITTLFLNYSIKTVPHPASSHCMGGWAGISISDKVPAGALRVITACSWHGGE